MGDAGEEEKKAKLSLATLGTVVAPPPRAAPTPLLRTLECRMVEVNRLSDIDIINQRFRTEIVVQLVFVDGNLDEDLKKPGAEFPLDGFGRPTFRPSAAWYMAQVDFNNAHEWKTLDQSVRAEGDDLVLNYRFEGSFSEVMEMEDFPMDVQDLTVSVCWNCRTTGMMPLEIVNSPQLSTGVIAAGFVDGMMWDLHTELDVRPCEVGRDPSRMFPTVELVMLVGRQPKFFLLNIALPVFFFVPMAMLQFTVPREATADRLSVSLAIVLTAVAHKYSMTTLVPAISYLTFLDKYMLVSLMLIVTITFGGSVLGALEGFYCRTQAVWDDEYNSTDVGRRLAARGGSGASGTPDYPSAYLDPNCPVNKHGPFNIFDTIDAAILTVNVILWLGLQVWAVRKYFKMRGSFNRRVEKIKARQASEHHLAEESHVQRRQDDAERRDRTKVAALEKKELQQKKHAAFMESEKASKAPAALTRSKTGSLKAKPALKRNNTEKIVARMPSRPERETGVCDEVGAVSEAGGLQSTLGPRSPLHPPPRQAPSLWRGLTPARVMANAPHNGHLSPFATVATAARDRERAR
jgi:hypothetical protein